MEVRTDLSYTELKAKLAKSLNRSTIPSGTLSRWMADLGYPRGTPGQRRKWDDEDLTYLYHYALALSWHYPGDEAQGYAQRQLLKFREKSNACNR